jgi:hypothetical protein
MDFAVAGNKRTGRVTCIVLKAENFADERVLSVTADIIMTRKFTCVFEAAEGQKVRFGFVPTEEAPENLN